MPTLPLQHKTKQNHETYLPTTPSSLEPQFLNFNMSFLTEVQFEAIIPLVQDYHELLRHKVLNYAVPLYSMR